MAEKRQQLSISKEARCITLEEGRIGDTDGKEGSLNTKGVDEKERERS